MMPNTNPPPWLKTLNNSGLPAANTEPAQDPSPTQEEHVEPLPQYEAPPPLNLGSPVVAPQPDAVTESNSTALPFAFDAAAFAATVESADDKPIQFDSPSTIFGFSPQVPKDLQPGIYTATIDEQMQVKPIATHVDPGYRYPDGTIEPDKIDRNKAFGPVAVPPTWNQPAEPVVTDPVPVAAPWLAGMSTPDVIAFDNHIQAVLAVNPAHAAILLRLKGWRSPYVGLLDTPDKAEQHIKICFQKNEPVGGWEDKGQQVLKKAELMLNEELARQRLQTLKHQHREFVNAARKAWKDAIEERRTQLELADIKVAALHESFKQAKELTFEEWKVLNDRQSS